MRLPYPQRSHECSNIVGENLCRIFTFRLITFPSPSEVQRYAGEMLGIFRHLKSVTGVIGGQEGDENQRIACSLLLVVHRDVICFDLRHGILLFNASLALVIGWR